MKKNKKNRAANGKAGKKTSLFGGAAKSLKKLGRGTANGIGGLSATQKVMGGAALVARGLSYFNKRRSKNGTPDPAAAEAAEQNLSAMDGSTEGAL